MSTPWWQAYDPDNITVGSDVVSDAWKVCVIDGVYFGGNEYSGSLGARISSIFVILFTSSFCTLFPVISARNPKFKIPLWVYLIARYFGTGVILATAFIHLIDPAYGEIGGTTCVGRTGHWADYSWCPAIMLVTVFLIFLLDLYSSFYVEKRYGSTIAEEPNVEELITDGRDMADSQVHNDCQHDQSAADNSITKGKLGDEISTDGETVSSRSIESQFREQFAAFLILEFGVLFHSVMIGLNLGSTGDEFGSLYAVLVFHQSFEGLGIGARLSAIPFPASKRWWPYALCIAYGLTTPISIAIGLGVRTAYDANSFTANIVSGVLDAISAGILIYTSLVELIARDFIFNAKRTKSLARLNFMVGCTALGCGLMALLGKWA